MYFRDLEIEDVRYGYNPVLKLVKVGWLDDPNFTKGEVSPEFIEKLKEIPLVIFTKGWHTCPFCKKATGSRQYRIPLRGDMTGKIMYDVPQMIIHYCEEHNYLPPQEFIDAVMDYEIPETRVPSFRTRSRHHYK